MSFSLLHELRDKGYVLTLTDTVADFDTEVRSAPELSVKGPERPDEETRQRIADNVPALKLALVLEDPPQVRRQQHGSLNSTTTKTGAYVREDHQDRAVLFRQAVLYLADRASEAAVLRAFGDPKQLDEAWDLPLEEFREVLRARIRAGLGSSRGAA
jgi:hypothetical protein